MKINMNMEELLDTVKQGEWEDEYNHYEASSTVKKEAIKENEDFNKRNINKKRRPVRLDKRTFAMGY